jgi:TonB family protein
MLTFAMLLLQAAAPVSRPTLISKVEPEYSELARKAAIQGTTLLRIEVGTDGLARNVRIERPSPDAGLDREAIKAVEQWRFSPGMRDGRPVRVEQSVEVSFRLLSHSDPKLSAKAYLAEARKGNADAQYGLGVAAYDERKFDEARTWFEKAAAQGLCQAEYRLGTLYEKGEGVAQDQDRARQWFEKSVAHTDYHLGVMVYLPRKPEK